MSFNWWTFLFQAINFVVLVYVLHRLLYRPLHDAIDRRREENSRARAEAEQARQAAAALERQLEARLAEIEKERQDTLRQARDQAESERRRIVSETDQVIKRRREEVDQQLQRVHEEAFGALRTELVQGALGLAERLLREAADASLQERLVARLLETLRALPAHQRAKLRDDWQYDASAVLESAAPCDGATLKSIEAIIEELAGRPVSLTVQTNPALIGGARLRVGGHAWDATLADRLDEARRSSSGGSPP
jgi:F-type H+-transporting ATPase subunit b